MQHPEKKKPVKCRQKAALWIAAVFLLLLAIGIVFLQSKQNRQSAQTTDQMQIAGEESITFEAPSKEQIASITITQANNGDSYTLLCSDGTLLFETTEGPVPVSETLASDFLDVVTQLTVLDTVSMDEAEYTPHLEEMGLQPAVARADIICTDGTTAWMEVGIQVPNTNGYYARYSGQPGVYICDRGVSETLQTEKKRLLAVEQPSVEAVRIDRAEILLAEERLSMTFTGDSLGTRYGTLEAPYTYPLSQDAVTTLLTAFQNLRLGTKENARLSDVQTDYGFDSPICRIHLHLKAGRVSEINQDGELVAVEKAEETLEFIIGREEGDYFYTCSYDGNVYLVSRFLFQPLVNLSSEKVISFTPANLGSDAFLTCIEIESPKGKLIVHAKRTEHVLENNEIETDEDGNVVYDLTITLNGTELSEERYDELCGRLNALTTSGTISGEWQPADNQTARWSVHLQTEGGIERTIEAFAMDPFSDALRVDGTIRQYISEEAIDLLVSEFLQ